MSGDNFSQKEIILQLLAEMKELRAVLAEHKELINRQSILNQGRDIEVGESRSEIRALSEKVNHLDQNFSFFKFKVTLIAGAIATMASLIGNRLFDFFFGV